MRYCWPRFSLKFMGLGFSVDGPKLRPVENDDADTHVGFLILDLITDDISSLRVLSWFL